MRTRAWLCVAGAAIAVGSLSAAQARRPDPPMVRTAQTSGHRAADQRAGQIDGQQDAMVYLLTGTGLVAIGGVVLVGGVAGLGGLDIPGGITMSVGRTRLWARSLQVQGRHRRRLARRRLTGG